MSCQKEDSAHPTVTRPGHGAREVACNGPRGPWQNAKFTSAKFPIQCPLFDTIATTIPGIANFLFTARPKLR